MEGKMARKLEFSALLGMLRESLAEVSEHRRGQNGHYEIADAGLAAFAVFFMQSPSFLSYQQDMERRRDRNNARSLFGVKRIPSDGQIRNLLDPLKPGSLGAVFWGVYAALEGGGHLDGYRGVGGSRLISLDGTQHFSSRKVYCANCRVSVRGEQAYYSHQVLLAVVCAPGQKQVICLEPEFILPQDGVEKQDCEQQAIKRWVERHAGRFAPWSVTILTDDLHCHQPTCELFLAHRLHFILTCKPDSHPALYEELGLLQRVEGAVSSKQVRKWNGCHHEQWLYRWAEQLPLRAGAAVLAVNWCELTIIEEKTGKQLYHNAWATDHPLDEENVVEVARDGRSRWKVENEGINVLKRRGYNFEHNYGHGDQHLSALLLTLLLLAFLIHTALDIACLAYQAVRAELRARRKFFDDLRALTRYLYFSSFEQLLTFMVQRLGLPPEPI